MLGLEREEDAPSQLRSELLPALGGPTMARWMPCRRISPLRPSSRYLRIRELSVLTFCRAASGRPMGQQRVRAAESETSRGKRKRTLLVDAFRDALVLAKVDERLDECHGLDRLAAHRVVRDAHLALWAQERPSKRFVLSSEREEGDGGTHASLPRRQLPLRLGVGLDEVPDALDLGQVHLAGLEREPSELAGLGDAETVAEGG